jgi:hypothetical protein
MPRTGARARIVWPRARFDAAAAPNAPVRLAAAAR